MIGDGTGQPLGQLGVSGMEGEKRQHRPAEIVNVLRLGLVAAASGRLPSLCEALPGPLDLKFGTKALDGRGRCPDAS